MKKNIKRNGPGRPAYEPKFPAKLKWTMADFCRRNEVDTETGKGPNCSKLTLVKFLKKDLKNRRSGLVGKLKDETAPPDSDSGLGRRSLLYFLRARADEIEAKAEAKPARKSNGLKTAAKSPVSVKLSTTADYEATKAALGIDTPAPTATEPAPTAPLVSVPIVAEPTPTPVAVTPAATVEAPATTPTEAAPVTVS